MEQSSTRKGTKRDKKSILIGKEQKLMSIK